jgi:hypothetical protein
MSAMYQKRTLADHAVHILIESWRRHCNGIRSYASLGSRPPAPEVFAAALAPWPARPTLAPQPPSN